MTDRNEGTSLNIGGNNDGGAGKNGKRVFKSAYDRARYACDTAVPGGAVKESTLPLLSQELGYKNFGDVKGLFDPWDTSKDRTVTTHNFCTWFSNVEPKLVHLKL